jgi:tyrosyl-tRNA synthetase
MDPKINDILTRGVANIIPNRESLESLFATGKKLNIYMGIDPTSTRIHIGHAVMLRKLNALAVLGHNVTFLIGDFTALIGDTSDKESERPAITSEQIKENFANYKKLASKVLDFSKIKVVYNSEWLSELNFVDIVKLTQRFSAGDFFNRELIKKRLNEGKRVGLHEVLYPVMQGYDSFVLDTDLQLGGTDQTFNMQAGRLLQKEMRQKESYVMTGEFLEGTDGRKMSKTWNNAIWLDDEPNEVFGKVMSLRDELIISYFELATSAISDEISQIKQRLESGENPMVLKKELASRLVSELCGEHLVETALKHFEETFQNNKIPDEINEFVYDSQTLLEVLSQSGTIQSNSDGKRLLTGNAIEINSETVKDLGVPLKKGDVLKVGKRKFVKLI